MFDFFFTDYKNVFAETVESHKLLIPGKPSVTTIIRKMRLRIILWRVSHMRNTDKKCYKKAFVIFQNSKLCTHDPHLCAQDYVR